MLERLLRKLDLRDPVHPEERQALADSPFHRRQVRSGQEIVVQGTTPDESILLVEGLTARVSTLIDGGQQITALHIPGDFVDLHSFLLRPMDHSVVALTPCEVAGLPHPRLRTLTSQFPHLTRLFWLSTLLDAAIHRQWLVGMGRQDALRQCAHLLCELYRRHEVVGLTDGPSFALPLTQTELANAMGRSRATVNAAIQQLRGDGLIAWVENQLSIDDWPALAALAEFDPTYLQLKPIPV